MTLVRPSTSLAKIDGVGRLSFARIPEVMEVPNLIQVQRDPLNGSRMRV